MAGAGFKTFNTGDVLTASDVNTYLMQQTVMVFASSAARTTALGANVAEGMLSYLKDTDATEVYDGSSWVGIANSGDITAVTAGTGITGGGTSGAVTITNSMATAIDAKGDLIAGTGADTFSRIAVGADNTVLTADSSTATGLKWAAASGGATFAGVSLYRSSGNTSCANNTDVTLTFDAEEFDTDSYHSTSTNTDRITIPSGKGGKYLINGSVLWASNATGWRSLAFFKNGSYILGPQRFAGPASGETSRYSTSGILDLTAGDYITMVVAQGSGGSLDAQASQPSTRFSAIYLGA